MPTVAKIWTASFNKDGSEGTEKDSFNTLEIDIEN